MYENAIDTFKSFKSYIDLHHNEVIMEKDKYFYSIFNNFLGLNKLKDSANKLNCKSLVKSYIEDNSVICNNIYKVSFRQLYPALYYKLFLNSNYLNNVIFDLIYVCYNYKKLNLPLDEYYIKLKLFINLIFGYGLNDVNRFVVCNEAVDILNYYIDTMVDEGVRVLLIDTDEIILQYNGNIEAILKDIEFDTQLNIDYSIEKYDRFEFDKKKYFRLIVD